MKWGLYSLLFVFLSCSSSVSTETVSQSESDTASEEEYSDGTWCADVEYYNPHTGTRNTYALDVEVQNGELTQINWPNGGWLDESHFLWQKIFLMVSVVLPATKDMNIQ